jgi:hypothetical protein
MMNLKIIHNDINGDLSVSGCDTAPNVKTVEERKDGKNFVVAERSDLSS